MSEHDHEKEAVQLLLSRGMDDLVSKAFQFGKKLYDAKLTTTQVHSLESVFFQSPSDSKKQRERIKTFLKNQARKEEKKDIKKWSKIGGQKASTRLFSLSQDELSKIKETLEIILREKELWNVIETSVEDLFKAENSATKEWIETELSGVFARKFMEDLIASYRILQKLRNDPSFKNIISQMETT